jgi:sterol desaturase/sphingolipid hydroxylase (fatty acid hydroxylase superfamily)
MTNTPIGSSLATVGMILTTMAIVALIETVVPLHVRGPAYKAHLRPNLALTLITFATNAVFNLALVAALLALQSAHFGLLSLFPLPPWATVAATALVLDFAYYLAHRAMHSSSVLWPFHTIHHSDLAVDVTTTIRQHPGDGVIRYAFMGAFAIALGAPPGPFAVYRIWSAVHGLLEHANIRMPLRLDALLSLIVATPNTHKVHHSRTVAETNSNYANIFALFDRVFRTFTPSERGTSIVYGLDGLDAAASQSTAGLLVHPFRRRETGTAAFADRGIAERSIG